MIPIIFAFGLAMVVIMSKAKGNNDSTTVTKFEPVNADRIRLSYEALKCGSLKATKVVNTAQFGLITIDIFKGERYSDNGLNFIEVKQDNKTVCVFDEMSNNDLILCLMMAKRL
jgi:hypothetical protein